MATFSKVTVERLTGMTAAATESLVALGDLSLFAAAALSWLGRRRPCKGTVVSACYAVGVRSVPVVAITGLFIGMVLAVQSYEQFKLFPTRLGLVINVSIIRELGPVLAATMLAGRVGSAMAAELATMRVTEQVDALDCLGVNHLHYLVVPRFLACVFLIPLLTIFANSFGVLGGYLVCTQVFDVESYHYWENSAGVVSFWDLMTSSFKASVFGAAIALICCHRGLHSEAGAEGVGRAATRAFVWSFIAILVLDFFLGVFLNRLSEYLWPMAANKMI